MFNEDLLLLAEKSLDRTVAYTISATRTSSGANVTVSITGDSRLPAIRVIVNVLSSTTQDHGKDYDLPINSSKTTSHTLELRVSYYKVKFYINGFTTLLKTIPKTSVSVVSTGSFEVPES